MNHKREVIRDYVITSLAVSMLAVLWIFCIDAIFYGTWQFLKVICSIIGFTFILCLVEMLIKKYLEEHFWISVILEFGMIALLFFYFGKMFHWYPEHKEYMFFIYAIPIYCAGYFLRLFGIRRDAQIINQCIENRKRNRM